MKVYFYFNGEPWREHKMDCIPQENDSLTFVDHSGQAWDCTVDRVTWFIDDEHRGREDAGQIYVNVYISGEITLL